MTRSSRHLDNLGLSNGELCQSNMRKDNFNLLETRKEILSGLQKSLGTIKAKRLTCYSSTERPRRSYQGVANREHSGVKWSHEH